MIVILGGDFTKGDGTGGIIIYYKWVVDIKPFW